MEIFKKIVEFIRTLYNEPEAFIPLHSPVFIGNEKKYLEECIDTTFVSSVGKFVDKFEEEIEKYTGATKAIACVNGTNALYLALKLAGVNQGHEVLTQPLTFIATANAIRYCNAEPVFIDVDPDTLGLSPSHLETWLKNNIKRKSSLDYPSVNKRTGKPVSGCVPMHTFGHPVRIHEIVEICNCYHIPVIEDAAESFGSFYQGQHTGTFGKIGMLSFNGNKIITTGGGGMLLFQDAALGLKAKHLTTQARIPHPWEFVHDEIGYNYRMPNINAAIGLAQLEKIDFFLRSKRIIAEKYKAFFASTDLKFVTEPIEARSNYWLNSIFFNDASERDAFLKYSNEKGVMTRPAWRLMNRLSMFRQCQTDHLQNATAIADKLVNIPSSVIL